MTTSDRLKQIIKSSGLTITEFSKICDIPYRSMQNYLTGKRSFSSESLLKICVHMGININWLLTGEGEMYIQSVAQEKFMWTGEEWLRSYWEQADEQERVWLEVQMKKCFPEFKEWLEMHKNAD